MFFYICLIEQFGLFILFNHFIISCYLNLIKGIFAEIGINSRIRNLTFFYTIIYFFVQSEGNISFESSYSSDSILKISVLQLVMYSEEKRATVMTVIFFILFILISKSLSIKWGRCSNDPFSGYIESRFLECFVIIAIIFFLFYPYYSYVLND